MSVLNSLKIPLSFIRKDIILIISARTFCSNVPEEVDESTKKYRRRKLEVVTFEKSIRYLKSEAYKTTYGDKPVWHTYVRNYKGSLPPDTRKSCIRSGFISTGSPCPICRDEYLVLDYRNIELLKQFISPYGGEVLETKKTGICQTQQKNLLFAIKMAQHYGLLTFPVPFRHYNYSLYNK